MFEQQGVSSVAGLAHLRDFRSKRASSRDRTGGNTDLIAIPGGKSQVLFDEKSAGCIKHFYWTYH